MSGGAASTAAMEQAAARKQEAMARAAGGEGWFSEKGLATAVKSLPSLERSGVESRRGRKRRRQDGGGDCDGKQDEGKQDDGDDARAASLAGPATVMSSWPLGAIDCLEEALEQVRHGFARRSEKSRRNIDV